MELCLFYSAGVTRDEKTQHLNPLTERLLRAQSNFFETFPLFASAVLIVAVSHTYSVYM